MSQNLISPIGRRAALAALAALLPAALCAQGGANAAAAKPAEPLKVGFVYVTPIGEAGWTTQHDLGRRELEKALAGRVKTSYVERVAEGADAERVIRDLAQQGHKLIFATSFGYMEPTIRVAADFPATAFVHLTGYKSAANVETANARFYEGRYLAGMVAGRMTRSNVAGYVAAFPIPEVLQGINAFTLGMRAVNPKAELKVIWTNSWYDPPREREAALTLVNAGADVLTHHTDSPATVQTAEEKGKWSVGYHSDMRKFGPKTQLTAVTHHWGAYYTRTAQAVLDGRWKPANPGLWGGIREGMVALAPLSERVPKDVQAQVEARRKDIAEGRFAPFSGRIVDSEGKLRQESGTMDDTTLNAMDYYVQGVQGKPPARR